jgi:hypothetical protein
MNLRCIVRARSARHLPFYFPVFDHRPFYVPVRGAVKGHLKGALRLYRGVRPGPVRGAVKRALRACLLGARDIEKKELRYTINLFLIPD